LREVLLVFLGGGLGSVSRYLIFRFSPLISSFPYTGTLIANVLGCFILGTITGALYQTSGKTWMLLVAVGFCGGLTTFSTFTLELMKAGTKDMLLMGAYLTGSLLIGFIALAGGLSLGKSLIQAV